MDIDELIQFCVTLFGTRWIQTSRFWGGPVLSGTTTMSVPLAARVQSARDIMLCYDIVVTVTHFRELQSCGRPKSDDHPYYDHPKHGSYTGIHHVPPSQCKLIIVNLWIKHSILCKLTTCEMSSFSMIKLWSNTVFYDCDRVNLCAM